MDFARERGAEVTGFLRFLRVLVLVLVAALGLFVIWVLWPPSPARLPPGSTALSLPTQPTHIGARLVLGCPVAGFPDLGVARQDDELVFIAVGGSGGAEREVGAGNLVRPIWPPGWSARVVNGRAGLVTPDGNVLAREGDVITGLGGGSGQVCLTIGQLPSVRPSPLVSR